MNWNRWEGFGERGRKGREEQRAGSVPMGAAYRVESWSLVQAPINLATFSLPACRQEFGVRDNGLRLPVRGV